MAQATNPSTTSRFPHLLDCALARTPTRCLSFTGWAAAVPLLFSRPTLTGK
jgi:hypothetical protein